MSQQGEGAGGPDWWSRLYDGDTPDTGRAPAGDSVDERYDSAARAVGRPPAPAENGKDGGEEPERAPSAGPRPAPEPVFGGGPGPAPAPPASTPGRPAPARVPAPAPPASFAAEPFALPAADPGGLRHLPPDTVLDGARYGPFTLRAVSTRGDAARRRGEPRREALLTARFGEGDEALVLVVLAVGAGKDTGAYRAAREVCHRIGSFVGRSHVRLSKDVREARRGALKSGLHRLTDRAHGRPRTAESGAESGVESGRAGEAGEVGEVGAGTGQVVTVRCLLLPVDPRCRIRVFFGVGEGGLFRLRDGVWQDLEPGGHGDRPAPAGTAAKPEGGEEGEAAGPGPRPVSGPFRFRASQARPGDTLLLCGAGLAEPMLDADGFADRLAGRWAGAEPPDLAGFTADVRPGAEGYGKDRTAAVVWEH